jgi:hypothetical protein
MQGRELSARGKGHREHIIWLWNLELIDGLVRQTARAQIERAFAFFGPGRFMRAQMLVGELRRHLPPDAVSNAFSGRSVLLRV